MRCLLLLFLMFPVTAHADCVVLLHGLARGESSMWLMQYALDREGYDTVVGEHGASLSSWQDRTVDRGSRRLFVR